MMIRNLYCLLAALGLCACVGKRSGAGDPLVDYYQAYYYYLGEDSFNKVQCVAEFRRGNDEGEWTTLPKDHVVLLDAKPLPLDTAVYPVYSEERSRETAEGAHRWSLKQGDRTLLEIPFTFKRFRLQAPIDSIDCVDADLPISISGLAEGDQVECWYDNSDLNNEADRFIYPVRNGAITLLQSDFKKLKQGSYKLRISSTLGGAVQLEGKTRGKWEASYILNPIPTRVR